MRNLWLTGEIAFPELLACNGLELFAIAEEDSYTEDETSVMNLQMADALDTWCPKLQENSHGDNLWLKQPSDLGWRLYNRFQN